jgi:hypothetical protein
MRCQCARTSPSLCTGHETAWHQDVPTEQLLQVGGGQSFASPAPAAHWPAATRLMLAARPCASSCRAVPCGAAQELCGSVPLPPDLFVALSDRVAADWRRSPCVLGMCRSSYWIRSLEVRRVHCGNPIGAPFGQRLWKGMFFVVSMWATVVSAGGGVVATTVDCDCGQ